MCFTSEVLFVAWGRNYYIQLHKARRAWFSKFFSTSLERRTQSTKGLIMERKVKVTTSRISPPSVVRKPDYTARRSVQE